LQDKSEEKLNGLKMGAPNTTPTMQKYEANGYVISHCRNLLNDPICTLVHRIPSWKALIWIT